MNQEIHEIAWDLAQRGEVRATRSLSLDSVMFSVSVEEDDLSYKIVFEAILELSTMQWNWQDPDRARLLEFLSDDQRRFADELDDNSSAMLWELYVKNTCGRLSSQYDAVTRWLRFTA